MKNKLLTFLLIGSFIAMNYQNRAEENKIIKATIAGTWYPADKKSLETQLKTFFDKAKPVKNEKIISLILPHAGYVYSGQTAAEAVSCLSKNYSTIIVLGPSHHIPMKNTFSVPDFDFYETPLGKIPADKELICEIRKSDLFKNIPEALEPEHSVQIEVPLLQFHLRNEFKLVFIVAGQCDLPAIEKAGKILSAAMREDTLLVVSSDFLHCGPRFAYQPFKENTTENLKKIDLKAFEFVEKKDARSFIDFVDEKSATICGAIPIAVAVSALPANAEVKLISYTNSGEITGDKTNTVSYISAIIKGEWKMKEKSVTNESGGSLSENDKKTLLKLARKTIEFYLKNKKEPSPKDLGIDITSDELKKERAAFVTLNKHGHLRGCIGEIFPSQPLFESVISNAINAAVNDYRFNQVTLDELKDIDIEISALTVPKEVPSYSDIKLGRDGIVLQKGYRKAVFLPQVAPEQGWDLNETLTHLSLKAGLSPDAWKEGAKFLTFQAEVFGEKE